MFYKISKISIKLFVWIQKSIEFYPAHFEIPRPCSHYSVSQLLPIELQWCTMIMCKKPQSFANYLLLFRIKVLKLVIFAPQNDQWQGEGSNYILIRMFLVHICPRFLCQFFFNFMLGCFRIFQSYRAKRNKFSLVHKMAARWCVFLKFVYPILAKAFERGKN